MSRTADLSVEFHHLKYAEIRHIGAVFSGHKLAKNEIYITFCEFSKMNLSGESDSAGIEWKVGGIIAYRNA